MKKALIAFAIVTVVVLVVVKSKMNKSSDGQLVTVEPVTKRLIRSSILASGSLAYGEEVQLRSEVIGKVTEVNVIEGQMVEKGTVVIRLDPKTFNAEVEQHTANVRIQEIAIERNKLSVDILERQFKRTTALFEKKLVDDFTFEKAKSDLDIAKVDLQTSHQAYSQAQALRNGAIERLNKTEIVAPITGMVTELSIKPGETVISGTTNIPGSTLVSIADLTEIIARVNVDEADIAKMDIGLESSVHAVAFPNQSLTGEVQFIATSARTVRNRQGLSFEIKILLDNSENVGFRPGMSCRAEIFTNANAQTIAVPVQAVLYDESTSTSNDQSLQSSAYVFVIEGGLAVKKAVTLGISNDAHQEILSGLSEQDTVIIGPYRTLLHLNEGAKVRAKSSSTELKKAS